MRSLPVGKGIEFHVGYLPLGDAERHVPGRSDPARELAAALRPPPHRPELCPVKLGKWSRAQAREQ